MRTKQILFTAPGVAELVTKELSAPMGTQVLLRTEYSAVSGGTERACLVGMPNTAGGFPRGLGYSAVSRVLAVGEDVRDFKVGDRVLVYHGCHASVWKTQASNLTLVPEGIDSLDAVWVIIASMALGGVRKLEVELAESAMVFGLGVLGVFATKFLKLNGACPVIVADLSAERRALGIRMGADCALDPSAPDFVQRVKELTGGAGVNAIVEVTGASVAMKQALECAAPQARIALLGCTRVSDCAVDYYTQVHRPGVRLIGAHNLVRPKVESYPHHWTHHDDCRAIMRMMQANRLHATEMISEIRRPEDCAEIYARLASDPAFPVGVVFDWRETE